MFRSRLSLLVSAFALFVLAPTAHADNLLVGIGTTSGSVREYTPTGALVGDFVSSSGGLNDPWNMTFGPNGNLYVASDLGGDVREFNGQNGSFIATIATGLSNPVDLKFDSAGSLYVAEAGANRISRINLLNGTTLQTYTNSVNGVYSLAFTTTGDLLATNYNDNNVVKIDPISGTSTVFATGITQPSGITLGSDGRYYIATSGGSVDVVGASGGSASAWSSGQSLSTSATFMTFDSGKLFVSVLSGVDYFDASTGQYGGFFSTGINNTTGITVRTSSTTVPEPGSVALLLAGGLTGAILLRRRRKAA